MSVGTPLLFGWIIISFILEKNEAWIHKTNNNNSFRQPHQKKTRITIQPRSKLWMGGYYNEPTDGIVRKDFDHMIFGLACVERRIDLIPEDPFIVLDIMDETMKDDDEASLMRLAKYLVDRREDLVTSKRVVVTGSSWISLLVARLGATSVLAWDEEQNETRLRILQHTDQFINRPTTCPVQTTTNGEDLENAELIIITSPVDDVYINDFLRRTDAKILFNSEMTDAFSYHSRIQEGADIVLW
jgi:hypothetical protein